MMQNKNIPQGYKNSPLGIIPQEWEMKRLGEIGTFSKGKGVPKDKITDRGYKCLTYGDIYTKYDVVMKNIKSFIDEGVAKDSQEITKGDILFASSGETLEDIGKTIVYLDEDKAYAGGDIIIFKCLSLNSLWLAYILNCKIANAQKHKMGQGNSIVHIYSSQLQKIKIPLPPLPEQQKIAEILTCWDEAIEKQSQLIEKLETRKRGIMQQLLTGKKRLKGFEGEWETVELGDVLTYQQPTPYLVSTTEYDDRYKTPVLTAGKTFILGYTNETVGIYNNPLPVIIFDDFTTAVKFVNFPFKAKSSAMKILTPKSNVNIIFVYAALLQIKYAVGGHERHWISKYSYLTIEIPSLSEQTAIANILSSADKEIEKEKAKLAALRSQKKGLMQVLLTGKKRVRR